MKNIRISTQGTPHDYQASLLPLVIKHLGYQIEWVKSGQAQLQLLGPFLDAKKKPYSWCPKPLRPIVSAIDDSISSGNTQSSALTLFHTQENVRHDFIEADFSISFDLGVDSKNHLRFPYWMEMIDWSHEGLTGNLNPRYGELLSLEKLKSPLGNHFLGRGGSGILLSSHLREPRASIYKALNKIVSVKGVGAHFDKSIKNHHSSGFLKRDLLNQFTFNICPENGLYPGYYTEKIPEAFYSGCLPITWTDENVAVDFNPNALINLLPFFAAAFEGLETVLNDSNILEKYESQALITNSPSLGPFKAFLLKVLQTATS
ncbi:hypothetical protein DP176_02610 [Polynucleobacter paneuropaeus]|uniref:Alpha-(1,3)-fucosyltransferase FucT N-terminal domain-containing protein n=1 Tax=Polynucleobacter paneuropaeus TaxID=2527775 RepID=A0ABX9FFY5_9BURK|nr:glycosyltransferase family 10 [Polynucleobacter paneuropaeus]QWD18288.1 hypothetical protein G6696_01325 [Polynucleobacter paneuropaeus]RAZ43879.1 hypothetical protein DP176_02610 [Polynucleobacter paneuropaeus]